VLRDRSRSCSSSMRELWQNRYRSKQRVSGQRITHISNRLNDRFAVGLADGVDQATVGSAAQDAMRKGRVAMIFTETPANPTNGLVDIGMMRRVADTIGRAGPCSPRRVRQHPPWPGVSATDRTRRGYLAVLPDEVHRRSLRPHRRRSIRLEGRDERRESTARSHRHPTGSAFLLDAQSVARDVEHPDGKSRRERAARRGLPARPFRRKILSLSS
jgi:hypothetical protein